MCNLYIPELVVTAWQVASVAQLVRALHQNLRAACSIPARGPIVVGTVKSLYNIGR